MTPHEKALDLARRLHALAQRGVGGEAVNAEEALQRLLKKHGLTMADIESEALELHQWCHKAPLMNWLRMVIALHVVGDVDTLNTRLHRYAEGWGIMVALTIAEKMECEACWSVWWPLMKDELVTFRIAFARANGITPRFNPERSLMIAAERSPEQHDQQRRADLMAQGILSRKVRKQLTDGASS